MWIGRADSIREFEGGHAIQFAQMITRGHRQQRFDLLCGQRSSTPFAQNAIAFEREMRGDRARHYTLSRLQTDRNRSETSLPGFLDQPAP
jgi:hypothetical protein